MTMYYVYYTLSSIYSVQVKASSKAEAKKKIGDMTPSQLDELDPVYEGWDLSVDGCDDQSEVDAGYSDFEEEEGED